MSEKKYPLKEIGIYCGSCFGDNIEIIKQYNGKDVVPENYIDYENNRGVVIKCNDCNEITGFLVLTAGVIDDE